MIMLARTMLSPVVESLMIVQMKKDKERGSEDIETFGHVCEGVGLIFFSVFGGILVTNAENGISFFYLTLISGILLLIAAFIYPRSSEDCNDNHQTNTVKGLNDKLAMIKQFLNVKEIKYTLIFFFIVSIVSPNLEEYFVYFNEEVHHLRPIFEGYSSIAVGGAASILVVLYNTILMKKVDLRVIVMIASGFRVLSSLIAIYQTKNQLIKYRVWLLI